MAVGVQAINARSACDELRAKVQADHVSVHPDQLEIPEHRLREITPERIRELAESIKEVGLLQPIGVKHAGPCTNRFIVIYGAGRARAMQLLRREAMEKAADPNKDPEVYRYSQVHAMRYRNEIDDETCEELEIRENLDRKELTWNERKVHILRLAAIIQIREKKRKHTHKPTLIHGELLHESKNKRGGITGKPVHHEVAKTIGVHPRTLQSRLVRASADVGKRLDLDHTPSEDLREAARIIEAKEQVPRKGKPSNGKPSLGQLTTKGIRLTLNVHPSDAASFARNIRDRHPASFSLDNIRAYRDALIGLVKELEAQR